MSQAATADDSSLALISFDGLDDDLIVAELQGRAVSTWAYRFTQDGQEVTGLSIAGVEQACRESGRHGEAIRILRHDWRETEDAYYGTVEAGRYLVAEDGREVLVDTALGSKREGKLKWSKNKNRWYTDQFAFEKAISKAARNAKGKLLDDELKAKVIALAAKAGQVRQVGSADTKAATKAATKQAAPPPKERVQSDEARRRFFATAGEMGHTTLSAIHACLRLPCGGRGNHKDGDPNACHALSEHGRMLALDGRGTDGAWEFMTGVLTGQVEPPWKAELPEDEPPAAPGEAWERDQGGEEEEFA